LLAASQMLAAMIGQLSGEERTAGFLVEAGLRIGRRTPGGVVVELPFGRRDMADYLSLNPDTLSRILSRLKAQGLLKSAGRSRYILPSWDQIKAHTPAAEPLVRLHDQS
jgi:CRP-like cAMP-binding protein